MMPSPHPSAKTGLTLLEVLIVIALLGLIGAVVTVRWATPLRVARVNVTCERWLAIDQFLRATTSHRSAILSLDHRDQRWVAAAQSDNEESLGYWEFDPRIEIEIVSTRRTDQSRELENMQSIFFETGTGTRDYQVTVRDGLVSKTFRIAGGTGEAQDP